MKPSGVKLEYKGLIRRLDYSYEIESVGGNWPVVVVPSSGSFVASSKTGSIDAQVLFCSDASVCPDSNPDVMNYNIDYSSMINNNNLFTIIRAKIFEKGTSGSDAVFSKEKLVDCQDCITQPIVTIPSFLSLNSGKTFSNTTPSSTTPKPSGSGLGALSLVSETVTDFDTDKLTSQFDIEISNLKSNTWRSSKYNYTITNDMSNWPVSVFPVSGTIVANTDNITIPTKLRFCPNPIDPSDLDNLDFSILSAPSGGPEYAFTNCDPSKDMIAILRVKLEPHSSFEPTYYSNQMIVRCDDCVVRPTISLYTSPNVVQSTTNNSMIAPNTTKSFATHQKIPLQINLNNLPKNIAYTYELRALRSDWPFIVVPDKDILYVSENDPTSLSYASLDGMFCVHSGICPSGQKGVLPYVMVDTLYRQFDEIYKPSIILQAVVKDVDSNIEYVSNTLALECTDCVQPYNPVIIK